MPKYEVEALRTIRSLQEAHARAGHSAQAEQMRRVVVQVEKMIQENTAIRATISEATAAIGNGSACSATASIEFMAGLPKEIRMSVTALRAELAALKEAARPVVDAWREDRICEVWKGDAGISELARLCGEE